MTGNILIVDDSITVRRMLRKLLTIAEVPDEDISEAANGSDALETMRSRPFSLVITDLNMDGISGIEMIDHIGEDPGLCGIPIVVISSEGSKAVQDQLSQRGVKGYVRKPFDFGNVRDLLVSCLG